MCKFKPDSTADPVESSDDLDDMVDDDASDSDSVSSEDSRVCYRESVKLGKSLNKLR